MIGSPSSREEHPLTGAAEDFFESQPRPLVTANMVAPLQKLLEECYASGREDAHHELVCELEGGEIGSRRWPR